MSETSTLEEQIADLTEQSDTAKLSGSYQDPPPGQDDGVEIDPSIEPTLEHRLQRDAMTTITTPGYSVTPQVGNVVLPDAMATPSSSALPAAHNQRTPEEGA